MRQIRKWRVLQLVYMPGVIVPLLQVLEDNAEDDIETAETVSLHLPSSLDPGQHKDVRLQQVAEHE